ncbi:MAG TPA: GNAT family N-acetyltransferase [Spirochaetia bacterium]|nr:GNAT family N-acetyltransferase [Spirochaetia bacterium]
MSAQVIKIRNSVERADVERIRIITASTGFFNPEEVDVAVELIEERLAKGPRSGYHFLFAEEKGRTLGYTCYGPIAGTRTSFDLYWIAVAAEFRGKGLGTRLLEAAESAIRSLGGTRVYIETSSRPLYESTRAFYIARAYGSVAVLDDFYAPGDAKVIYLKVLR